MGAILKSSSPRFHKTHECEGEQFLVVLLACCVKEKHAMLKTADIRYAKSS